MAEKPCAGDHSQHICALVAAKHMDVVKGLITEPHYMCLFCGRVADLDDNICKPVHVDAIGLDDQ